MFTLDPNHIVLAGQVIGGLVSIWAAVKFIFKPFTKFVLSPVLKVHQQIDFIEKELKNNGGMSLKDLVQGINKKLGRLERRQYSFLDHTDQLLFETDSQGRFLWVSKALLRALNVSEEDMLFNSWRNTIDFSDQERVVGEWDKAIKDCRNVQVKFRFFSGNGKVIPVYCEGTAQKDDKGAFAGFVGSIVKESKN